MKKNVIDQKEVEFIEKYKINFYHPIHRNICEIFKSIEKKRMVVYNHTSQLFPLSIIIYNFLSMLEHEGLEITDIDYNSGQLLRINNKYCVRYEEKYKDKLHRCTFKDGSSLLSTDELLKFVPVNEDFKLNKRKNVKNEIKQSENSINNIYLSKKILIISDYNKIKESLSAIKINDISCLNYFNFKFYSKNGFVQMNPSLRTKPDFYVMNRIELNKAEFLPDICYIMFGDILKKNTSAINSIKNSELIVFNDYFDIKALNEYIEYGFSVLPLPNELLINTSIPNIENEFDDQFNIVQDAIIRKNLKIEFIPLHIELYDDMIKNLLEIKNDIDDIYFNNLIYIIFKKYVDQLTYEIGLSKYDAFEVLDSDVNDFYENTLQEYSYILDSETKSKLELFFTYFLKINFDLIYVNPIKFAIDECLEKLQILKTTKIGIFSNNIVNMNEIINEYPRILFFNNDYSQNYDIIFIITPRYNLKKILKKNLSDKIIIIHFCHILKQITRYFKKVEDKYGYDNKQYWKDKESLNIHDLTLTDSEFLNKSNTSEYFQLLKSINKLTINLLSQSKKIKATLLLFKSNKIVFMRDHGKISILMGTTIKERNYNLLKPNDICLIYKINKEELRKHVDIILQEKGQSNYRVTSQIWRNELYDYLKINDFDSLHRTIKKYNRRIEEATLKNWIENKEMIGPKNLDFIDIIMNLNGKEIREEIIKDVKIAIKNIRKYHIVESHVIKKEMKERFINQKKVDNQSQGCIKIEPFGEIEVLHFECMLQKNIQVDEYMINKVYDYKEFEKLIRKDAL